MNRIKKFISKKKSMISYININIYTRDHWIIRNKEKSDSVSRLTTEKDIWIKNSNLQDERLKMKV